MQTNDGCGGRAGFAVERRERGEMNHRRFSEVLGVESSSSGDCSTVGVGIDLLVRSIFGI